MMTQFVQMMRSADMRLFQSAIIQLSTISVDEALRLVTELGQEPDAEFRCRALIAIPIIFPDQAESFAVQFLYDPDPGVRVTAVDTLRKLGSRRALPFFEHLLTTDSDEIVRSWAAFSLGQLSDVSALPALIRAAEVDQGTDCEGTPIRETALIAILQIQERGVGAQQTDK